MKTTLLASLLFSLVFCAHGWNQCGIRGPRNRVAGGREAGLGEWPWQVQLKYFVPGGSGGSHNCGSSILDAHWILTAAHCILNAHWILTAAHCMMHSKNINDYAVYVGQHNVNRPGPYTRKLRVSKLIQHPKYTYGVAPYDIALVKIFNRPVGRATSDSWVHNMEDVRVSPSSKKGSHGDQ